jgi:hypothetical protein
MQAMLLISQWDKFSQLWIAQEKSTPEQCTEDHGKRDFEETCADAHVSRNCTSQIADQQNSAESCGARNQVENRANGQDDSEGNNDAFWISELDGGFHDKLRLEQFHAAIEEKKQCGQRAENPACPKRFSRNTMGLAIRLRDGIGWHIIEFLRSFARVIGSHRGTHQRL